MDIAIGPFNIDRNIEDNNIRINKSKDKYKDFITKIFNHSQKRGNDIENFFNNRNKNPRCFLAIEIEKSGSSKYMLGNIANVSILGSIGIVVPFNEKQLSLCGRIKEYINFATEVKKVEKIFENVLIIDKDNFSQILKESG